MLASSAATASAATTIQQSANYTCGGASIGVSPPRVRANHGRPETVVWIIVVERYNGAR